MQRWIYWIRWLCDTDLRFAICDLREQLYQKWYFTICATQRSRVEINLVTVHPAPALPQICDTLARWLNAAEPSPSPDWPSDAWETVQLACRVHGVAPLLHEYLRGGNWVTPAMQEWLAEQYDFNARRVAKMHGELKTILALLHQNNVSVIPLKGSVASVELYADAGWRPMADLDLLIHAADFEQAGRLLSQLGYKQDIAHWKHTEFSRPENRRVISATCEHPDNPRKLEIHLHCRESFGGALVDITNMMWSNSFKGELLGEPTVRVTPEIFWLHLLVHNGYHLWQGTARLIHLVDIARLLPRLNTPLEPLNAVDARFTYPALVMLNKYFPSGVSAELAENQHGRVSAKFRQWADSLDLVNSSYLNPASPGLYMGKALRFAEGRPGEIARALRLALLPNLQEMALDHPRLARSKAPWLAYFLLPVDWAKRSIATRKFR